ncbi:hypothetical protein L228DRAFT_260403 [Xylona heveae TC161]|uniref:CsbD-like domain-containing protein n=1 Tax=Xylona heveae (strain CBS 132557 / TC161) TaxID=1328760 RepID=A0A165HJH5_XYLHT|nr:hypothetical protein L228DRAFT_260403 [Xylona heveae TC161]KZF23606.1 hypothetical protein L228DRAFT_260403 [Xylona heveae TC161]
MSSGQDNTSTLQSYVDKASGYAQSALGAVTGSNADKNAGQDKKDKAELENDLSHTTAKAGPYTVSASGGVAKDDPNRAAGSWNQTIGSGKEMVGNFVGAEGLRKEGIEQNRQGKGQEAQGQLSDLGSGFVDRAQGAIGGAAAGFTGNKAEEEKRQAQHDAGKAQQRGAEADIQKQA